MLHYTRLERLAKDKYSSLLGPFVSYEEKEMLRIRTLTFLTKVSCINKGQCYFPEMIITGVKKFIVQVSQAFKPSIFINGKSFLQN